MKKYWKLFKRHGRKALRLEYVLGAAFFLVFYFLFAFLLDEQTLVVLSFARDHIILGSLLYVIFFIASIVFVPLSSLPIVLFTKDIWGVFLGGTLSGLGWWIGSIILFFICRYLGRPLLSHVISFKKMDAWEKQVPKKITFTSIILAHMVLPAAIPSFIFGISRTVSFPVYASASFIGVFPMAYLIVAAGGALFSKDWIAATFLGLVLLFVFLAVFFIWQKYFKQKK